MSLIGAMLRVACRVSGGIVDDDERAEDQGAVFGALEIQRETVVRYVDQLLAATRATQPNACHHAEPRRLSSVAFTTQDVPRRTQDSRPDFAADTRLCGGCYLICPRVVRFADG
jgi:hypothetical protein